MFITVKKIVAINYVIAIVVQGVAIKFEVIDWTTKNFIAINSRYFNDNFDTMIYMLLQ